MSVGPLQSGLVAPGSGDEIGGGLGEILAVRAGGWLQALRVASVVEVVRPLPVAELPRVPAFLKGAAQFHAEVIPILDLALWLAARRAGQPGPVSEPRIASTKARLVVVTARGGSAGLLVDEIVGVWREVKREGDEVVGEGQRAPLLDLDRVVDWRQEP